MKQIRVDFLHKPDYDWISSLPSPYAGIARAVCIVREAVTLNIVANIPVTLGAHYTLQLLEIADELICECKRGRVVSNLVPIKYEIWHVTIPVRFRQVSRFLHQVLGLIAEKKIDDFEVLLPSTTIPMSGIIRSLLENFPKKN